MAGTAKGPTFFLHYPTRYKEQALTLFILVSGGYIHVAYQILIVNCGNTANIYYQVSSV